MSPSRQAREQELALSALSLMRREKLSLREAAKRLDISPSVVLRHVKDALRRSATGNYYAKPSDTLRRPPIRFFTEQGSIWINVKDSRDATLISKHMTAVRNYLYTGRESFLAPFRTKRLGPYHFVTDPEILDELADAGELDFDKYYKFVSGGARG
jgi:hypothetical protein